MGSQQSPLAFWGMILVKFVVLLLLAVLGMLLVDPYYFQFPIAQDEAGLPIDKTLPPPFETTITFRADPGYPVMIALGAKDQSLGMVSLEVTGPDGAKTLQGTIPVDRGSGPHGAEWREMLAGAPIPGTYTLRLRQNLPGRIAVFFFQGPFVARLLMLPALVALLLLLIQVAVGRSRKETPAA